VREQLGIPKLHSPSTLPTTTTTCDLKHKMSLG
jgi:hypothetical protein